MTPDPFDMDVLREQEQVARKEMARRELETQKRRALLRMSEDELLEHVRTLCQALGLLHYHTHDSRGSQPGYPDWHIVGTERSIFREMKSERGDLTEEQKEWLSGLRKVGQDAEVWRPSDLLSGRIQRELSELARSNIRRRLNV